MPRRRFRPGVTIPPTLPQTDPQTDPRATTQAEQTARGWHVPLDGLRAAHAETSYGAHQEAAAAMLNRLLVDAPDIPRPPGTPASPGTLDTPGAQPGDGAQAQLLACREAVIDAWRDRLHVLGHHPPNRYRSAGKDLSAAAELTRPSWVLFRVLDQLPRTTTSGQPGESDQHPQQEQQEQQSQPGQPGQPSRQQGWSPLEALATPSTHPAVELWRTTAVELTAANHALHTTPDPTWMREPTGAWHLLRDAATGIEALTVLDDRLRDAGLHHGLYPPDSAPQRTSQWSLAEQRVATSHVARVAGWYAVPTPSAPTAITDVDLAKPATLHRAQHPGPGHLVHEPADLITAQRQVARYITAPLSTQDAFSSALRSMDATTLLGVIRSQHDVCRAARDQFISESPGQAGDLAQLFEDLRDVYTQLLPHARKIIDTDGTRGINQSAMAQQREINTAITRRSGTWALSHAEGAALATATHDVLRELAHATRRELRRDAGTLRVKDPIGVRPPHKASHHGALYLAFNTVAKLPPPIPEEPHWVPTRSREGLTTALTKTPVGKRPSPYPRRDTGATTSGPTR